MPLNFYMGYVPSLFRLRSVFVPSSFYLHSVFAPSLFPLCSVYIPSLFFLSSSYVVSMFLLCLHSGSGLSSIPSVYLLRFRLVHELFMRIHMIQNHLLDD